TYIDIIGVPPKTGVAVLDQIRKSNGAINSNYVGFLKTAKLISRDNRYFLRTRPDVYLHAVVQNYRLYVLPASDGWMFHLQKGRADIRIINRLYSLLLGQRWPRGPAYFLVVGFPVLLAFGFYVAKAIRKKDVPTFITLVFLIANILYLTLV